VYLRLTVNGQDVAKVNRMKYDQQSTL